MLLQRPNDRLEPWFPHRFISDFGVPIEPAYKVTVKLVQLVVDTIDKARDSSAKSHQILNKQKFKKKG